MVRKLGRLFVIKNRFEAGAVIYALALGGSERGQVYLTRFPGLDGKLLFLACCVAVFMAGAKIMDAMKYEREARLAAQAVATDREALRDSAGLAVARSPKAGDSRQAGLISWA